MNELQQRQKMKEIIFIYGEKMNLPMKLKYKISNNKNTNFYFY